jgi:hypothetical protein
VFIHKYFVDNCENDVLNFPGNLKIKAQDIWRHDDLRKKQIMSFLKQEVCFIEIWENDINNHFPEVKEKILRHIIK